MSVWYRQTADGEVTDQRPIDSDNHPDLDGDDALLARKAASASDHGWDVAWTGERSFTATKTRWGGTAVIREFWIE